VRHTPRVSAIYNLLYKRSRNRRSTVIWSSSNTGTGDSSLGKGDREFKEALMGLMESGLTNDPRVERHRLFVSWMTRCGRKWDTETRSLGPNGKNSRETTQTQTTVYANELGKRGPYVVGAVGYRRNNTNKWNKYEQ
jgi:hypothetical protein